MTRSKPSYQEIKRLEDAVTKYEYGYEPFIGTGYIYKPEIEKSITNRVLYYLALGLDPIERANEIEEEYLKCNNYSNDPQ